ncbi:hypothetical protein HYV85_00210 [Candidatus Woesearchaeota archaeon]|nr:hypothetical protein [Candidatus Woesearchaeota archaeon]
MTASIFAASNSARLLTTGLALDTSWLAVDGIRSATQAIPAAFAAITPDSES